MTTADREEKTERASQAEYDLDYGKAKPNRFAVKEDGKVIVLDPDVAQYFKDSESVNRVLRALIENMPQRT